MNKFSWLVLLAGVSLQTCAFASEHGPVPVELVNRDGQYVLLRGGKPYHIKGAGMEYGDIAQFAALGGNSIRNWTTEPRTKTAQELLDIAHAHEVTVSLCLEIGRERQGFDYDDEEAVAAQLEYARAEVLKYKDHPALLTWLIGNEPNLQFENPKVFDAINDISEMIHEVDGKHPTTTAMAGFNPELAELLATRSPDLDFISMQFYGAIVNLPRYLDEMGFEQPYMVTEWGAVGHWEVPTTTWDAPIEQNSTAKADNYLKSYRVAIESDPEFVIGSYVFLWGQKQERTPTWYGVFLEDGSKTEAIDVMNYIWTGEWPENRSPRVHGFVLDGKTADKSVTLASGSAYPAIFDVTDPDGDTLTFRWTVMRESQATQTGGDKEEVPETVEGVVSASATNRAVVTAPSTPGEYRLFVYARDGQGNAAHANIPFLVTSS